MQAEAVERVVPHRFERGGDRAELLAAGSVEAMAPLDADLDQPGLLEPAQVLGDGAEGDVRHRAVNLAGRALAAPDEPQDLPPARCREGGEGIGHENSLVKTKLLSTCRAVRCNAFDHEA